MIGMGPINMFSEYRFNLMDRYKISHTQKVSNNLIEVCFDFLGGYGPTLLYKNGGSNHCIS